ncbi:MAG: Ig-like domain-containing protein [Nevskia sp.]|nr:Ig-like domain-containing protein [Nevskia sp.]
MRGQTIAQACAAALLSLVLVGCGGGGGGISLLPGSSSSSSGGTSSSSSSSSGASSSSSSGASSSSGGATTAQTLTLTSAQSSITADGLSAAVLTAQIISTTGQPIAGLTLNFSTSAGSLSSNTGSTDSSGHVVIRLIASTIAGRATVTVREPISGLSAFTNVTLAAGPAANVSLVLAPSTVLPGATTSVDAIVVDAYGNAVSGEPVTFSVNSNASGGSFQNVSSTSDTNGRAATTYSAGSNSGSDVLGAKTAGGLTGSAQLAVNVGATLIGSVQLTLGATSVAADGTTQTTLRALVSDTNSKPVPNVVVSFSSTIGTLSAVSATTDNTGNAAVLLTSPSTPGVATVVAKTAGFSSSAKITFVAGAPANVILSASPSRVPVGGKSTVQAMVTDAKGTPVSGVALVFSLSANNSGATLSTTNANTDANGNATVTYQSGTVASGSVMDTVKATAAGASGSNVSGTANIQVSPNNAVVGTVNLVLGTSSIPAAANNSIAVNSTVIDTSGNPVVGAIVSFATTAGTLSASSATTNANGQARVTLLAPTAAGTLTVQASAGGFYAEQNLSVVPGAISTANSSITASPSSIVADGTSTSTITVLLNDSFNNPQPNGTSVTLLTQAGTFVGSATQSLTNGSATFTLKAPSSAAPNNVVTVQGLTALKTPVAFITNSTGDPSSIRFKTSPTTISVGGVGQNDQSTITVTVVDSSGTPINEAGYTNNPINNLRLFFIAHPNGGETLTAKDVNGTIQTSTTSIDVRTTNGIAVVSLQSGTISGVVEVEAEVLKFSGTSLGNAGDIATTAAVPQLSIAAGPASSIVFSYPITNSITNLGNGNYRRKGKVDVSDRYGNPVADGSVVNLAIMDSVIAQDNTGVTAAGSPTLTRSGSSLITRRCTTEPPQGGEASNCSLPTAIVANDFTSTITRNGTARGIQNGDLILIQNAVTADKRNTVSSVGSATQLTAISNYLASLSSGQFWVGTAALGASIGSLQTAGNETGAIVPGTATTVSGIAEFRITYPANVGSIFTGCYGYASSGAYSTIDLRSSVPQSRQTVVVASAGAATTAIAEGSQTCFAAIAGATVTPNQTAVALSANSSTDISLLLRDGGDTIPLPYTALNCTVSNVSRSQTPASTFAVSATVQPTGLDGNLATDVTGSGVVRITRTDSGPAVSGDSATVSCQGADSKPITITVSPNLP